MDKQNDKTDDPVQQHTDYVDHAERNGFQYFSAGGKRQYFFIQPIFQTAGKLRYNFGHIAADIRIVLQELIDQVGSVGNIRIKVIYQILYTGDDLGYKHSHQGINHDQKKEHGDQHTDTPGKGFPLFFGFDVYTGK